MQVMPDENMPQHKEMAMGEMPKVEGVETPWKSVPGPKGSRELSDEQRNGKKA